MITTLFFLILGFILLIEGANLLVEGSSSIAKKYGISNLVIGLTIVSFGTSAPELLVSSIAVMKDSVGIAMGNIVGSNIANTLLVLGAAAAVRPLVVSKSTVSKEIPFSFLAVLAVIFVVNDGILDGAASNGITRIDGLILLLFFAIFIYYTYGMTRMDEGILDAITEEKIKTYKTYKSAGMVALGIIGLYIGGRWIVDGGTTIAAAAGVSEELIGLTIIAVGTSLPELAASVVAAWKGEADISIGNVVGSNIFNLLWVLGATAVIRPIGFDMTLNADFLILILVTLLLLFLVFFGRKNVLARDEGAIMLMLYAGYLAFLVYRG